MLHAAVVMSWLQKLRSKPVCFYDEMREEQRSTLCYNLPSPTRVLTWCCLLGAEYGPRMCSAVIHSLSEILPVYEVLTIMQDIGYWKHELLGCIIYGRYKWVHPLHCCMAIWMLNSEHFIILYCMWRKYIEDCPRKYLMLKKFLTENSNVTV